MVVERNLLLITTTLLAVLVACGRQEKKENRDVAVHGVKNNGIVTVEEFIEREFALEDSGDYYGAIEVNKQILEISPDDPRAYNSIAGIYGKLGFFDKEIEWANKAIRSDAKYFMAYINLGNALAKQGKMSEAKSVFKIAEMLAPASPLPSYSLGALAEDEGDIKEAICNYEKALTIDSTDENSLFGCAAMYANQERFQKASFLLKRLLILNPHAEDAKQMLVQVYSDMKKQSGRH